MGSAEIDKLAEDARGVDPATDTGPQAALWEAMFDLESWWFPITNLDDPRPFLGVLPEGPALVAFTSIERANAWALGNGFEPERAARVISMSPDSTVDFVEQLVPQGVQIMVVDPGVTGFFAPLTNLRPMQAYIRQSGEHDR